MSISTNPRKTPEQWLELITAARQSGLTDAEWCRRNSINRYSFNTAIKRLRKKACAIPGHNSGNIVDLTNSAPAVQEVVKVGVCQDNASSLYPTPEINTYGNAQPAIEISLSGAEIRIYNSASPALVSGLLSALGGNL